MLCVLKYSSNSSVSVLGVLEGTLLANINVVGLLAREGRELGTEGGEMESGDLLVELLGEEVDLTLLVLVGVGLGGVAEVVGLEEDALHEGVVGEVAEDLGEAGADAADVLGVGRAVGEGADAGVDAVDAHEGGHGGVAGLASVPG